MFGIFQNVSLLTVSTQWCRRVHIWLSPFFLSFPPRLVLKKKPKPKNPKQQQKKPLSKMREEKHFYWYFRRNIIPALYIWRKNCLYVNWYFYFPCSKIKKNFCFPLFKIFPVNCDQTILEGTYDLNLNFHVPL